MFPKYTPGKKGNGKGREMICMQPAGARMFPDRSLPGYINSSCGMADGLQLTGAKTNDSFISRFLLNLQCRGADCRGAPGFSALSPPPPASVPVPCPVSTGMDMRLQRSYMRRQISQ